MPETLQRPKYKFLSGSMLKLIAVLCMVIDHAALILWPVLWFFRIPLTFFGKTVSVYWILRRIGRLAFPIFCFLIAEGFSHTRDQKKYGLRLLIFAFISEIPFNLMHSGNILHSGNQNVYFTLFLGLMMIYAYENIGKELWKYLAMTAVGTLATLLRPDYGLRGVILMFVIHLLQRKPAAQAVISYPLLSGGPAAFAAFVPINLYNGKRGFIQGPVLKFLFYIFYPLHILILVGIRYLLA